MLFISGEKGAITGDIHTSFLCRHNFDHNKIPMRRDDFWVEEREKKRADDTVCVYRKRSYFLSTGQVGHVHAIGLMDGEINR